MSSSAQSAELVVERLAGVPGGPQLLAVAREREDVFVVGGAVRDLLLDQTPRELDVVVEGDVADLAAALAALLPGRVTVHDRFGTASLEADGARVDLAAARTEHYPEPGALPVVTGATLEEDLARRDFTVNAIAVSLGGDEPRRLQAVEHAQDDLAARRLRVLHEASFRDDPTRLLRLARYAARLGFAIEETTLALAGDAIAAGALRTVSDARVGAELRLLLAEPEAVRAVDAAAALGLTRALHPHFDWDPDRARRVLELLPPDGRSDLVLLASCTMDIAETELQGWLDRLELTARERDVVVSAATRAPDIAAALAAAERASAVAAGVRGVPVEAVALAGALGQAQRAAGWLTELRHVRLEIDGDDLLAAGVAPGPAVGRGLATALARRLDGELAPGREAELEAALIAAVPTSSE